MADRAWAETKSPLIMAITPTDFGHMSAAAAEMVIPGRAARTKRNTGGVHAEQTNTLLRAALLLWAAAILGAAVTAPLAASAARPEGWFLYEVLEPFCHQQPKRTWHFQGHPLGVCARCLGVYAGLLLAALAAFRLPPKTIAAALALLAVSWVVEFTGLASVSNGIRSLTGLFLGASAGAAVLAWESRRGPRWLARPESAAG